MKFILRLSCDDASDDHDKAVVEIDQKGAESLLLLKSVLSVAQYTAGWCKVDEISFTGMLAMDVVAAWSDSVVYDDIRENPPAIGGDDDVVYTEETLDYDVAPTEFDRLHICDAGVHWTAYPNHSHARLISAVVPWASLAAVSRGELP